MKKESSDTKKSEQKRKSIIVQFSVRLSLVITTLFAVLGIVSYSSAVKGSVQSFSETMSNIVPVYAGSIDSWNQQLARELHLYTKSDFIADGDIEGAVAWIRKNHDRRPADFNRVLFCGLNRISRNENGQDLDVSTRDYVKKMLDEGNDFCVSDPMMSKVDNSYIYMVCSAAYDKDHNKIGFFAGVVSLDSLQKIVETIKVGSDGYLVVNDENGVCIAHRDKKKIMTKMNEQTDQGQRFAVKTIMSGQSGIARYSDGSYSFFCPIQNTSWSVSAVLPASEVNATANRLGETLMPLFILFVIIIITITALTIRNILKPLRNVEKSINDIASGNADLTRRIDHTVNNEIGSVVSGFNTFVGKLQGIMIDLKKSKEDLSSNGSVLQMSIEDTASAITQILSDISSAKEKITDQSAGVEETAGAVTEITQNIVSLEKMIENQASGITEASAAVEQMIGNIGSVNKSVEQMVLSFSALEERAKDGMAKQTRVSDQITLISTQSEMLEDANAAIAGIANQTNLLSMNAAIEAAHAGTAGKGFSVVADEIRKLSETSSEQSKKIGNELKKIRESIGTVVTASVDSTSALSSVFGNIKETDMIVTQIKSAMEEQLSGSKQIGEALHMMNDSTSEVRTASSEMSAGQKAILDEVKRLQDLTIAMKEKMAEMETGAGKINETGAALSGISKNTAGTIERIGSQIDQFKV